MRPLNDKSHLNVVDLFSGVGGLSLGAARAGFSVRGAVEIDRVAIATHEQNFPKTFHECEDVSEFTGIRLRNRFGFRNGDLTGIIGGPPCQGFSNMGRRDPNDPRNNLFPSFFRIVSEARPKFFLAENVPGILHENYSNIIEDALSYVEHDYVILPPITLSANDYGVPTTRKRVFFIGYLADEMNTLTSESFNPPENIQLNYVRDAFEGLPLFVSPEWQTERASWQNVEALSTSEFSSRLHGHVPNGVGHRPALEKLKNERRASGFLGTKHSPEVSLRYGEIEQGKSDPISKSHRLDPDGFCPTLRAGTGRDRGSFQAVRPIHPTEARVITPREAARLQGFPDWFQFSPTKWHSFRQIGSSVSPILAEHILSVIIRTAE